MLEFGGHFFFTHLSGEICSWGCSLKFKKIALANKAESAYFTAESFCVLINCVFVSACVCACVCVLVRAYTCAQDFVFSSFPSS